MIQTFSQPPRAHLADGAVVIPYPNREALSEGDLCEHYVGTIEHQNESRNAHIKILRPKALANELIAAALGRALGIPIPDYFLLEITPQDHSYFARSALVSRQGEPRTSKAFALATIEPQMDWSKIVGLGWKKLERWIQSNDCDLSFLMQAILFDEWILNSDRNPTNFQLDGKNKVWAIDHESCFTGDRWEIADLRSQRNDCNDDNELAQEMKIYLKESKLRNKAQDCIDPFICLAGELPLHAIILVNSGDNRLAVAERASLKEFLEHRLTILEQLVYQQLEWPYQKRMLHQ